jgi:hypothetical protein
MTCYTCFETVDEIMIRPCTTCNMRIHAGCFKNYLDYLESIPQSPPYFCTICKSVFEISTIIVPTQIIVQNRDFVVTIRRHLTPQHNSTVRCCLLLFFVIIIIILIF